MSINIYWACNEKEWLRAKQPEPIYSSFIKNIKDQNSKLQLCPSVKQYMNNTFSIKSIYDYSFQINENENIFSNVYDQNFFDTHVQIRSTKDKLFSFKQQFLFFTDEDSLLMSAGIFPFLENNNITKKCIPIPGEVDIGKWFRQMDFAFYLKNSDSFEIEENEIYQYTKFHTNKKINFKQFKITKELNDYLLDVENAKISRKIKNRPLQDYYFMLKHKKYIIEEIKSNLI
jgi:hypothetical protein